MIHLLEQTYPSLTDVLSEMYPANTHANYNRKSVVDYFATSQNLKALVNSFEVLDVTKFSDVKPCVYKLNIRDNFVPSEEILGRLEDVPKNKWNNEKQSMHSSFLSKQHGPSTTSKLDKLCETPCMNKKDVINLNDNIISIYREIAEEVLPRKENTNHRTKNKNQQSHRTKPKCQWFDIECIKSKRELKRLAKSYGRLPINDDLRESYSVA